MKLLKSNLLVINYELLSFEGKVMRRKQSFSFLPLEASEESFYSMGKSIGDCLISAPKSIEQNTAYTLVEA